MDMHRNMPEFDGIIEIEKGPKYLETAKALSDYIAKLPLTSEQNDNLINLIHEHSQAGRAEAFSQALAPFIKAADTTED